MNDRLSRTKQKATTFSFMVMMFGATISYFSNSMDVIKLSGYGLTFIGLIFLLFVWPIQSLNKFIWVTIFALSISIFSLIPILLSSSNLTFTDFQYSVIYPFTIFMLILYGYRVQYANLTLIIRMIYVLALINGTVAILASLGFINSVPVIGEIDKGRYIFGTNIPSSSGLNINVNYFSTTQAVLLLVIILLKSISNGKYKINDYVFLTLIFLSSFFGSSRGVLIGLVLSFLTVIIINYLYKNQIQKYMIAFALLFLGIPIVILVFRNLDFINDFLMEDLRFRKGVNGRDEIWQVGLDRWVERPLFGWGSSEFAAQDFVDQQGRDRSFHNSYVNVLYRGGVSLFIATYGLIVFVIIYNVRKVKDYFYMNRFNFAIIVFFLFNAAVRNFSVGGIGLLPLSLGIALSLCLYSNKDNINLKKINLEASNIKNE